MKGYRFLLGLSICCTIMLVLTIIIYVPELVERYQILVVLGYDKPCSGEDFVEETEIVCKYFKEGKFAGPLCQSLCIDKDITFHSCPKDQHASKKAVFFAQRFDKQIALKIRNRFEMETYGSFPESTKSMLFNTARAYRISYGLKMKPTMVFSLVLKTLHPNVSMQRNWDETLPGELVQAMLSNVTYSEAANLWHMAKGCKEFLATNVFAGHGIVPQPLGYCGHIYAVERVRPFKPPFFSEVAFMPTKAVWRRQLEMSMQFLDHATKMNDMGIFNCDMHASNYGYSDDGNNIVMLDTDTLEGSRHKPRRIFCRNDFDCHSHLCHGVCVDKRCITNVTNDNVQLACEGIFLGHRQSFEMRGAPGLLQSPFASERLRTLVKKCSTSPINSLIPDSRMPIMNKSMVQELRSVLSQEIKLLNKI